MRKTVTALIMPMLALAASPALAETLRISSQYSVSALGLPIAISSFETRISSDAYSASGTLRTRGLAALFQPTSGSMKVSGRIDGDGPMPENFVMDYVSGGDRQYTELGFAGRAVTRTVNSPEVPKKRDWVAVSPGHLQNALDPISATIVAAASLRSVCDHTIRFFDGAMRGDMKLSYVRTIPFSTNGYKGDAVTCEAKFVPVSGYRSRKKEIAWMRDKGHIELSFAPVGDTGLYAPVKAVIATQIGPVQVYATRFVSETR